MDAGFYTAAAGMQLEFNLENVLADNLANMQTTGYKDRSLVQEAFQQQLTKLTNVAGTNGTTQSLVGTVGEAPVVRDYGVDLTIGAPRYTGQSLDTMIAGDGFFTVKNGNQTLLTRNGNFYRSAAGQLVTKEGYQVLDSTGKPIAVPAGTLTFERNGGLAVNGVASNVSLGLARLPAGQPVTRVGTSYYVGPGTKLAPGTAGVAVMQGYLEGSNVDLATQTTDMMAAQRTYQADSHMLQVEDEATGLAVTDLGKVAS